MSPTQSSGQIPVEWLKTDEAREFMEFCFSRWEDGGNLGLTSAEKERYDGWIGEFILAALAAKFEAVPRS